MSTVDPGVRPSASRRGLGMTIRPTESIEVSIGMTLPVGYQLPKLQPKRSSRSPAAAIITGPVRCRPPRPACSRISSPSPGANRGTPTRLLFDQHTDSGMLIGMGVQIAVRLADQELEHLDAAIARGTFPSRAAAVRAGLHRLLQEEREKQI